MTEQKILSFLKTHYVNHGVPATVKVIQRALGFKSPRAVTYHLEILAKKGDVVRVGSVGNYLPAGFKVVRS